MVERARENAQQIGHDRVLGKRRARADGLADVESPERRCSRPADRLSTSAPRGVWIERVAEPVRPGAALEVVCSGAAPEVVCALAAVQLVENPSTTGQILVMDGGQIMP